MPIQPAGAMPHWQHSHLTEPPPPLSNMSLSSTTSSSVRVNGTATKSMPRAVTHLRSWLSWGVRKGMRIFWFRIDTFECASSAQSATTLPATSVADRISSTLTATAPSHMLTCSSATPGDTPLQQVCSSVQQL